MHAAAAALVPEHEARWLVEEARGLDRSGWSTEASAGGAGRLRAMVERRRAGEPLQYVLGRWSFRGLDLLVDARVLIPRPETEIVAEAAIAEAVRTGARRRRYPGVPGGRDTGMGPAGAGAGGGGGSRGEGSIAAAGVSFSVADLGTGSGALALALAVELPGAEVWATDADPAALAVARANLAALRPGAAARVRVAGGSWYDALPAELAGRLRVIVSNPPYVAEAELAGLPPEVRDHEPCRALVSGPSGTEALEHLLAGGLAWLAPGGALVLELAPHQAGAMAAAAGAAGYDSVAVHPDLTGRDRVLVARRP